MELEYCAYRGKEVAPDTYPCSCPNVGNGHEVVTGEICKICPIAQMYSAHTQQGDWTGAAPTENTVDYPGVATVGANFIAEFSCWKKAGKPLVSEDERLRRKAICHGCDRFDPEQQRCKGCGCRMEETKNGWLGRISALAGLGIEEGAWAWATKKCPHPDGPKWLNTVDCDGKPVSSAPETAPMPPLPPSAESAAPPETPAPR